MNLKQCKKNVGSRLKLRPLPIGSDGIPQSEDQWQLEAILEGPSRLKLVNISTGHIVELQPDNVQEYRTPDFLLLRCQLIIEGQNVKREPILGSPPPATRLKRASARLEITSNRITISDIRNISRVEEVGEGTLRIIWTGEFLDPAYEIWATQTRYCDVHVQETNLRNAVISIRRWRLLGGDEMGFVIHAQGEQSSAHFSELWCAVDISMVRGGHVDFEEASRRGGGGSHTSVLVDRTLGAKDTGDLTSPPEKP